MTDAERVELALRRTASECNWNVMPLQEFIDSLISNLTEINNTSQPEILKRNLEAERRS